MPLGGYVNFKKFIFSTFCLITLSACVATTEKETTQPVKLFAGEGTVITCSPTELIMTAQIPDFPQTAATTVANIKRQVVQKSYLLEETKIMVDGREAKVTEVRGNSVKLVFSSAGAACPAGRKVSLQVPKKTIAVVDFDVSSRGREEKGKVVLEGLTSALIDTGQFIVLERSKLQSIMNEIQLSLSGITRPTDDKVAGNC